MSLNGKRDNFTIDDFRAVGDTASMKRGRADAIVAEVTEAARRWSAFAEHAGVEGDRIKQIALAHRLDIPAIRPS
jgi:serine/threonine-protein kinase HipA